MKLDNIIIDYNNKVMKIQELITERIAWEARNYNDCLLGEEMHYTDEDFLDMAVAFRQLSGEEINME